MSIMKSNDKIIIQDGLTGKVIISFDDDLFSSDTLNGIINDIVYSSIIDDDHGLIIKKMSKF